MLEHPIVAIVGAMLGIAIGLDLCAAMLGWGTRTRGPQPRCADEIRAMCERADERRKGLRRHPGQA